MEKLKSKRTLMVSEIVNFTGQRMWVYGTSGELVLIEPRDISHISDYLQGSKKGVFYVAKGSVLEMLRTDIRYKEKIAKPVYSGEGMHGEAIHKFYMNDDETELVPITGGEGVVGRYIEETIGFLDRFPRHYYKYYTHPKFS